VRDTGPGVPRSRREAIFEPFFTTHDGQGGSGLGLYVSQEIVSRHGGQLCLEESTVGARFAVELPLR
jgi:two-component system NtrC family sensor kinase